MGVEGGATGSRPRPGPGFAQPCRGSAPATGAARIAARFPRTRRALDRPLTAAGRAARWTCVAGLIAACATRSPAAEEGLTAPPQVTENPVEAGEQGLATDTGAEWRVLFDGADLSDWQTGVYGDPPEYELVEGGVVLPQTAWLSGLTYTAELPRTPYRLEVEATRRYGSDFFLGVTFPVRDAHLTLVLGGWGGGVTGLSCIDGRDASENDTRTTLHFPNGKRQRVVIDVSDERVTASVNGEVAVDRDLLPDEELSLRTEVLASRPLGLAAFATSTTVHAVRVQELPPASIQARRKSTP